MSEFWAIVITVIAGAFGMLGGAVLFFVTGLAADSPAHPHVQIGFALGGMVLGTWIALRRTGFQLAEITAALAVLWVLLLTLSVGPILEAIGPTWFPIALPPAALVIARTIAGPFVPYIVARPTAVATANR